MRVREVNFFGSISSKIIMEDKKYCYLEVYYEESKSIYRYDKEEESIIEITSTTDFSSIFFVDDYTKKIYQYNYKSSELVIKEFVEYESFEVFRKNIGKRKDIENIFALNNHIFINSQGKNHLKELIIYSIKEDKVYEVLDSILVNNIKNFFIIEKEDDLYLVLEERSYKDHRELEIKKRYKNTELSKKSINLYNFNKLIEEIKVKKDIGKSLLIDTMNNEDEDIKLLGVYRNKAVVFQNNEKKRLLCFSVDDSVELRTLKDDVSYIVTKESLLLIQKKESNIEVFKRDNKVLFTYTDEEQEEEILIRAFIKGRFLIYSKNNIFGDKSMNIYDSFTKETKIFNCDFLMIDKELI